MPRPRFRRPSRGLGKAGRRPPSLRLRRCGSGLSTLRYCLQGSACATCFRWPLQTAGVNLQDILKSGKQSWRNCFLPGLAIPDSLAVQWADVYENVMPTELRTFHLPAYATSVSPEPARAANVATFTDAVPVPSSPVAVRVCALVVALV